ncbi:MAG: hypothetical protein IJ184_02650 [Alphaproteobacteria bacterium]|nr:hypothetical protein [Alphaproteobacteria bacterium]
MKKLLLLTTSILTAWSFAAPAATIDCKTEGAASANCTNIGYTMSSSDCSGYTALKCPFGNYYWCKKPQAKACEVGDIVYSDNKCYAQQDLLPSDLTALAVVVDADNQLAVDFDAYPAGVNYWSTPPNDGYITALYAPSGVSLSDSGLTSYEYYTAYSGITNDEFNSTGNSSNGYKDNEKVWSVVSSASGALSSALGYCYKTKNTALHSTIFAKQDACMSRSTSPCSAYNYPINPWFVPRIGDLHHLVTPSVFKRIQPVLTNYGEKLCDSSCYASPYIISTTLSVAQDRVLAINGTNSSAVYQQAVYIDTGFLQSTYGGAARCYYYYGSNWSVQIGVVNQANPGGGAVIGGGGFLAP